MHVPAADDLDVREPELAQRVAQRLVVGREPVTQALDERAEGVDREPGLVEAGGGRQARRGPDPA